MRDVRRVVLGGQPDRTRALVVKALGERALADLLAIGPADLAVA
ncbi:hypothetical protein BH10ACT10_BH10ACT10_03040 [soil metagenome]